MYRIPAPARFPARSLLPPVPSTSPSPPRSKPRRRLLIYLSTSEERRNDDDDEEYGMAAANANREGEISLCECAHVHSSPASSFPAKSSAAETVCRTSDGHARVSRIHIPGFLRTPSRPSQRAVALAGGSSVGVHSAASARTDPGPYVRP